jgi:hypothetical protein
VPVPVVAIDAMNPKMRAFSTKGQKAALYQKTRMKHMQKNAKSFSFNQPLQTACSNSNDQFKLIICVNADRA